MKLRVKLPKRRNKNRQNYTPNHLSLSFVDSNTNPSPTPHQNPKSPNLNEDLKQLMQIAADNPNPLQNAKLTSSCSVPRIQPVSRDNKNLAVAEATKFNYEQIHQKTFTNYQSFRPSNVSLYLHKTTSLQNFTALQTVKGHQLAQEPHPRAGRNFSKEEKNYTAFLHKLNEIPSAASIGGIKSSMHSHAATLSNTTLKETLQSQNFNPMEMANIAKLFPKSHQLMEPGQQAQIQEEKYLELVKKLREHSNSKAKKIFQKNHKIEREQTSPKIKSSRIGVNLANRFQKEHLVANEDMANREVILKYKNRIKEQIERSKQFLNINQSNTPHIRNEKYFNYPALEGRHYIIKTPLQKRQPPSSIKPFVLYGNMTAHQTSSMSKISKSGQLAPMGNYYSINGIPSVPSLCSSTTDIRENFLLTGSPTPIILVSEGKSKNHSISTKEENCKHNSKDTNRSEDEVIVENQKELVQEDNSRKVKKVRIAKSKPQARTRINDLAMSNTKNKKHHSKPKKGILITSSLNQGEEELIIKEDAAMLNSERIFQTEIDQQSLQEKKPHLINPSFHTNGSFDQKEFDEEMEVVKKLYAFNDTEQIRANIRKNQLNYLVSPTNLDIVNKNRSRFHFFSHIQTQQPTIDYKRVATSIKKMINEFIVVNQKKAEAKNKKNEVNENI